MGSRLMGGSSNKKKSKQVMYSEEFQAFLDRLEEEDNYEEEEEDDGYFEEDEEFGINGKKRRKLRLDQVKGLEEKFEVDRRLGPTRKAAIAAELGLEPRQVAVWFQNRRARSKTKQLEREFSRLQAVYADLRQNYDSLERETKSLQCEVKDLEAKVEAKNASKARNMNVTSPTPVTMETLIDETSPPPLSSWWPTNDAYVAGHQIGFVNGELSSAASPWDAFSFDQPYFC